jgi:hypothetical protein
LATISNTPRPGYVWDSADNVWYPIGVGAHQHTNAADTPAVIPNALVDAKGDLLTATADNTPARLAVGANGETLVADSSTSTGLRYTAGTVQGNPLINSAFQVWQRGTSVGVPASNVYYTADRWELASSSGANYTISRQATGDTTNLPFIQYAARVQRDSGQTGLNPTYFIQGIESVNAIPYAGKTVTMSFYARRGANFSATSNVLTFLLAEGTGTDQNPAGAYDSQNNVINTTATLTTTWQRFSATGTIAATSKELKAFFTYTPTGTAGAADHYEVTGVQIDIGSVALPFRTYAATIQGELAACRYYYERILPNGSGTGYSGIGHYYDTTNCYTIQNWQEKRVIPTVTFSGATHFTANGSGVNRQSTAVNLDVATTWGCDYRITTSSVTLGSTAVMGIQSTSGYIEASAEL